MLKSKIVGTGSYLPAKTIDNDFLSTIVETSDEWIMERTGIRSRHIASEETTISMGVAAARAALSMADLDAENIDLILVATLTPDYVMPNAACMIQAELGAKNALCFDISAACSGFLFGLQTADAYIRSGMCKHALIIGAETLSRTVDWTDRSTCILFGDGAGAAVLSASDDNSGFIDFVSGSDGSMGSVLELKNRPIINPYRTVNEEEKATSYMYMNGQEVFKFAVRKVPELVFAITERNNITPDEIDHYILHQANERILQSVSKRLSLPIERFPMNLDKCGNTSAASIPILLDECNRSGLLKKGDSLILSGFGGGLTWGCALLEW